MEGRLGTEFMGNNKSMKEDIRGEAYNRLREILGRMARTMEGIEASRCDKLILVCI